MSDKKNFIAELFDNIKSEVGKSKEMKVKEIVIVHYSNRTMRVQETFFYIKM